MDQALIKEKVKTIASGRELLTKLLEKPDIGNLRLDVNQALEELEELVEELQATFPED
ncbi:MAG: hypothetical protein IGQ45_08995 [Cyanobacterium sp. T60_A2020_053]|nr:hypothetical protein [Cyanobacterium sp. T60_A2020_053]